MTSATSRAGSANPFGTPWLIPVFGGVRVSLCSFV